VKAREIEMQAYFKIKGVHGKGINRKSATLVSRFIHKPLFQLEIIKLIFRLTR